MFIILINRILFCIHGFYEAFNFIPYLLLWVEGEKKPKNIAFKFSTITAKHFFFKSGAASGCSSSLELRAASSSGSPHHYIQSVISYIRRLHFPAFSPLHLTGCQVVFENERSETSFGFGHVFGPRPADRGSAEQERL